MYLNYPLHNRMWRIIFSSMACVPVTFIPLYVIKSKAFGKNRKICFVFFPTCLSTTFRIVRRIEGHIINEPKTSCPLPVIHVRVFEC